MRLLTALSATTLIFSTAPSLWACPMCKLALETDDPQPRAYMVSILFMLGMIMSAFGGMAGLLVWVSRTERRALSEAGYDHVLHNAVSAPADGPTNA
jgi:hypothetical protein